MSSRRGPAFEVGLVHVGFVVDKVALEKIFSFFLSHPFSTFNVTLPVIHMNIDVRSTLLLSEGQVGEAWAPSDISHTHSCIGEHEKRKSLMLLFVPQAINAADIVIRNNWMWAHARYRQRSPYSKQKPRTFLHSVCLGRAVG